MREHNFKSEKDAKRYAVIALNQIADLCDDLGISFRPGEEDGCDDLWVFLDGSDFDFCHEPDKYLSNYTLAAWLRYHTKQLQEELESTEGNQIEEDENARQAISPVSGSH